MSNQWIHPDTSKRLSQIKAQGFCFDTEGNKIVLSDLLCPFAAWDRAGSYCAVELLIKETGYTKLIANGVTACQD